MLKRCFMPVGLFLALGGFFLGFSGGVDDAHITFWAAETVARYGEILNYNLDRVEQSSSLLQVLVVGALRYCTGLNVVMLSHVMTLLLAGLSLLVLSRMDKTITSHNAAIWLLASSPFFTYWAYSGMEGPWLALLLLLLVMQLPACLSVRGLSWPVLVFSWLAQCARPEAPLLLCVFAMTLLPVRWWLHIHAWRWRSLLYFLLLQIVMAILLAVWRQWYFGDVLPQPVSAKVAGFSITAVSQGLQYVQQTWLDWRLLPMALLIIGGVVFALFVDKRPLVVLAAVMTLVVSGFVVTSGGDWMAAGRFWVPAMPLFCLLAAVCLSSFISSNRMRNGIIFLLIIANSIYWWRGTAIDFNGIPLWKKSVLVNDDHAERFSFFERHARENLHDIPVLSQAMPLVEKIIAMHLVNGASHPVVIMAGQMGMVPFYLSKQYAGKIRFIDRNGITERTLTDCAFANRLPRTRNGIGTGYEWILDNRVPLEKGCQFVMPDIVFDIETSWNRRNIKALEQAGYVFIYRQRGHVFNEPNNALLPLRKIGAGEFLAVSHSLWLQLGSPAPVEREFGVY